jgi:uncharacterized protein YbgA (DUF1722 family)
LNESIQNRNGKATKRNAMTMDKEWNKQYEKLVEFKRKNGNCLVPQRYQEDVALGNWVANQRLRQFRGNNKMRQDRKELLDELGFVWRVVKSAPARTDKEKLWKKQYAQLVEFKQKNGNCLVPRRYQEDESLGRWVSWQRVNHGKNKLRVDRKGLLDEIGFVWIVDTNNAPWEKQYEKLVDFEQKNGHCLVPKRYQEDLSLGKWVCRQRGRHLDNKMRQDRKGLLDEIGFSWKVDTTIAAHSSTVHDVSCRHCIISCFIQVIFLTLVLFLLYFCVLAFGFGSVHRVHQQCGSFQ